MSSKKMLSVVVPCYNEEEVIEIFYKEVIKVLENLDADFEIIFIDDGSNDNTLNKIKKLKESDKNIRYISFSRNFGKEAAIFSGFRESKGDYVVLMDADLQHPPKTITQMYEYIKTDEFDIIATKRVNRKGEPKIRSFFARRFYKIANKMSDVKLVDGAMDFRMMKRVVVDAILEFKEYNRFTKGIYEFVGFNTKWISIENEERAAGNTKWSFFGLFKYAVEGILSFSVMPLVIISFSGILISFISMIFLLVTVIKKLAFGNPTPGYASTIAILCFLGGVQIFATGIIGQYISKIYLETKNRPIYIVKEKG